MRLPMDLLTHMMTHQGLPEVTVDGTVIQLRMVIQVQAQTPAVAAHLTGCRPLRHSPVQLTNNFVYSFGVLLLLGLSFCQAHIQLQSLCRSGIGV
jgi:hypothetical protein